MTTKLRDNKRCRETKVIQTHRVLPSDTNPHNTLFGGKLMSIIDDTASISATRHSRRQVVTASMDTLNFIHPIPQDHSVCVETYVTGVGKTSLEVFAKVMGEDLMTGERYLAATSFITFVALPIDHTDTVHVPLIEPETKEEIFVCANYHERRQNRLLSSKFNEEFSKNLISRAPWITEDYQ